MLSRIEEAFDPWIDKVFNELLKVFPLPGGRTLIPANRLKPPRVNVRELHPSERKTAQITRDKERLERLSDYRWVTLTTNARITSPEWFQDVRHIEFDSQEIFESGS